MRQKNLATNNPIGVRVILEPAYRSGESVAIQLPDGSWLNVSKSGARLHALGAEPRDEIGEPCSPVEIQDDRWDTWRHYHTSD